MNGDGPAGDEATLLLNYVAGRDIPCPACGYNLRDLRQPRCPECREDLTLAVGLQRPRFGWFLATIVPGCFSGIAAGLLLVPIVISFVLGAGPAPPPVLATDAFGFLSGIAALLLVRHRFAFLRLPAALQRASAVAAWAIHVAAFAALVTYVTIFT